jgi:hypothetical protein
MAIIALESETFEETSALINYEVLWQVSLQKHPQPNLITDWRDVDETLNKTLETIFQIGLHTCTVFAEGKIDPHTECVHGDWKFDLTKMEQQNTVSHTVRKVRRMLVSFRPLA